MTNKQYWLYLSRINGLGPGRRNILLGMLGSPEEIYKASEKTLRGIPLLEDYHIEQLLCERNVDFGSEEERLKEMGIEFVSVDEENFPERLKNIPDAPDFLFYKGKLPKDSEPAVAVVGSRKCSFYGRRMCLDFTKRLAEAGIIIVSGMAMGVDGFAHRGAIEAGGKTIAVLGCGVDICYPPVNKEIYNVINCVVSEFYPGSSPLPYNFPQRNRIISGLSDVLLVVEAGRKSGTFITVDHALEQGREIFAIPGRIGDDASDGCNNLIKNGAHLASEPEDIIEELKNHYETLIMAARRKRKKKSPPLPEEEKKVYECLSYVPMEINDISKQSGVPWQKLPGILINLEMNELIEEVGKNQYVKR